MSSCVLLHSKLSRDSAERLRYSTIVIHAIMQCVACVKLVDIELATSLSVQYDIRKLVLVVGRGTVEGSGVSAVRHTYVP